MRFTINFFHHFAKQFCKILTRVRVNTKNVTFPIGKVPSENLPALTQTLWEGSSGLIFLPKRSSDLWGALWARFCRIPFHGAEITLLFCCIPEWGLVVYRSATWRWMKTTKPTTFYFECKNHKRFLILKVRRKVCGGISSWSWGACFDLRHFFADSRRLSRFTARHFL